MKWPIRRDSSVEPFWPLFSPRLLLDSVVTIIYSWNQHTATYWAIERWTLLNHSSVNTLKVWWEACGSIQNSIDIIMRSMWFPRFIDWLVQINYIKCIVWVYSHPLLTQKLLFQCSPFYGLSCIWIPQKGTVFSFCDTRKHITMIVALIRWVIDMSLTTFISSGIVN